MKYRFTCTAYRPDFKEQAKEAVELEAQDDWHALVGGQQVVQPRRPGWVLADLVVKQIKRKKGNNGQ